MIHGIDVSAYQSEKYSTSGLDFVFTKVTEGLSYVNQRWAAQRDHAKAHGLVWGAYHYPHMANDPHAEADYFLKQVKWQPGDIIVLDWEGYDSANKGVSKARQLAYRDAWLKHVKSKMPGHRVGMYCNTDYWLHVDTSSTCGDFLWIATAGAPAGQPGIKARWIFHQYSTAGGIDHDVADFPSRAALAAWAKGATAPTPQPTSQEDDMQPIDVWAYKGKKNPQGTGAETRDAYWYLRESKTRLDSLTTQVAALTATVKTLAGQLGHDVDTATVVDAVQKAIADAVVKVSVDVTGNQGA